MENTFLCDGMLQRLSHQIKIYSLDFDSLFLLIFLVCFIQDLRLVANVLKRKVIGYINFDHMISVQIVQLQSIKTTSTYIVIFDHVILVQIVSNAIVRQIAAKIAISAVCQ